MDRNTIVIDLDGTITVDDKEFSYEHKPENSAITTALKNAKFNGYDITISTSRNMRTYQGDIDKIKKFTQPIIEDWLKRKDVPYDQLIVGKPWCGPAGFYVDDKNLHLDEFLFRFGSAYTSQKMGLIFFDVASLASADWPKLSRLFELTSTSIMKSQELANNLNSEEFQVDYFSEITEFSAHLKNDKNTFYLVISEKMNRDLYTVFFSVLHKLNNLSHPAQVKIHFYDFLENTEHCTLDRSRFIFLINKEKWLNILNNTKSYPILMEKLNKLKFDINLPFIDTR